jgi:hypothetical protein
MICVREMRPREHHCHICGTCIPQYDHHCTWINNCVGKHNLLRFNTFLIVLTLSLTWLAYLATHLLVCTINGQTETLLFAVREWTRGQWAPAVYTATIIVMILVLLFGVPLVCLILVQMKNLLLGKTTYERFSKSQESILTREGSLLNSNRSSLSPTPSIRNCIAMCFGE